MKLNRNLSSFTVAHRAAFSSLSSEQWHLCELERGYRHLGKCYGFTFRWSGAITRKTIIQIFTTLEVSELNTNILSKYAHFCIYGAVGFASAELWVLQQLIRDNIWICTHWSALKFQKYSLYHITGQGVSRANKCNSGFQRYCLSLVYIVAAMCSNVIVTEKRKLTGPQNVIRLS
jgi:hypothetical protein